MKIRTITFFIGNGKTILENEFKHLNELKSSLKDICHPLEIQTVRISLTTNKNHLTNASIINHLGDKYDFPFISLGIYEENVDNSAITAIINENKNLSLSYNCKSVDSVYNASRIMMNLAEEDVMNNFRFAAGLNLIPYIPFFPSSFGSDIYGFSIGLEWGDTLYNSFNENRDINILRDHLYRQFSVIENIGYKIEEISGYKYIGTDYSLNPSVDNDGSIAYAFDFMISQFGSSGTLALVKQITDIIKDSPFKKTGYNGIMFPIMEDRGLAHYWSMRTIDAYSIILYSTVCGCGLDMIPLPGDISSEQIALLINDLKSVSDRYQKPLSARMLPMPGLTFNSLTTINSPYIVNTKI